MITRIQKALAARRDAMVEGEKGFTLIELLVVVIIIGILAAIAIPVYIGVQNNAKDSAVQSDLTNIKTAVVAWYQDNSTLTTTPALNSTTLGKYGFTQSATYQVTPSGTPTFATGSTSTVFCVNAVSVTGTAFSVTSSSGVAKAVCGASSSW